MKYPYTYFSSHNMGRENGGAVYAIWRARAADDMTCAGFLAKNRRGKWQIDMATRYYSQRIQQFNTFAEAKQAAREYLA